MTEVCLQNVTKKIKKDCVISDISMNLHSGRIYGIQGCNGSGKTMLMRLIAGLILPTEGVVSIAGKVLGKDITFPESIGILLENPSFLDYYTGLENLQILADIKGTISKMEIEDMLELVGLDPKDKRKYKKYSLGMKQKLGIAAAVMEKNDILLVDEPTNALDVKGVSMVKELLLREKERGALIMVASHEQQFLLDVSDEVFCLESGLITKHDIINEE